MTAISNRYLAISTLQILPLDWHVRSFTQLILKPFGVFESKHKNREVPIERVRGLLTVRSGLIFS